MCGFVGFSNHINNADEVLGLMMDRIKHRGPDSEGKYIDENVAMGFRRLSLIDLSENGGQPIYNEDKTLVLTFNGEIYNFKELRAELEQAGHSFYTKTDSEVLIHGYEEWGEELLDKLNMSGNKGYGTNKNAVEFISTAEYDHTDYPFLHTLRQARIVKAKDHSVEVGYIGQLHPMVAENYGIKGDCYVAVINMDKVVEMADFDIKFTEIAKYPASTRDLALVSDRNVYVGDIEKIIRKNAGAYLENLTLFDVFEDPTGEKLDAAKKSVAYSLTFRASDHSLSGDEVNEAVDAVLKALSEDGIVLRA